MDGQKIRDSFIFYRSYYEAIKDLPRDIRGEVYTAIMEYGLNGITTENLKPVAKSIFTLIKPKIDKGIKLLDKDYARNSTEYRKWRIGVFIRDNYTCQKCGIMGGVLNAHHLKPFSKYPEYRFDQENGITLCRRCHIELHKSQMK